MYDLTTTRRASDFVISRFRKKFGLWYEINERGTASSYIAEAHLTDAESFLMIWITTNPAPFDCVALLGECDVGKLFVAWETRHDSRRAFEKDVVERIACEAFAQFRPDKLSDDVTLISFEFRSFSKIGDVSSWFSLNIPTAKFVEMPPYKGKLIDEPGFQLTADPHTSWGQLVFPIPISREMLVAMLSIGLAEFGTFETGVNVRYRALRELQEIGVDEVQALGRRY